MATYTKEFLVAAYLHRFLRVDGIEVEQLCTLEENASDLYDRVGKERFRVYASLDADAIRTYKNQLETA
jgi:hypothetical protein